MWIYRWVGYFYSSLVNRIFMCVMFTVLKKKDINLIFSVVMIHHRNRKKLCWEMITKIMKRIARTSLIESHRSQRHVIAHTLLFSFRISAKVKRVYLGMDWLSACATKNLTVIWIESLVWEKFHIRDVIKKYWRINRYFEIITSVCMRW